MCSSSSLRLSEESKEPEESEEDLEDSDESEMNYIFEIEMVLIDKKLQQAQTHSITATSKKTCFNTDEQRTDPEWTARYETLYIVSSAILLFLNNTSVKLSKETKMKPFGQEFRDMNF